MESSNQQVFQFKITLKGVAPPIWRRILVPGSYTFWDFHVAIQDAMGWTDTHLHRFDIVSPEEGRATKVACYEDDQEEGLLPGHITEVREHLGSSGRSCAYSYDFGDDWRHSVVLEKVRRITARDSLPACLAGRRACPPEDCGGPRGYEHFLEAISDPAHEEHRTLLQWVGGQFDPATFDPEEVVFEDPKLRWRFAMDLLG